MFTFLQVDLGHGVFANAVNLQFVSRADFTKTTYTLCEVLFTREELCNSSLTGKKSNAFRDVAVKEKLDENKVRALIGMFTFVCCIGSLYVSYAVYTFVKL